jgi:hypothetical protein
MEEKFSAKLEKLIEVSPLLSVRPSHFRDLLDLLRLEALRREEWEQSVETRIYSYTGETL